MNNQFSSKLQEVKKKRQWLNKRPDKWVQQLGVEEISISKWFKQADAPIIFKDDTNTFTSNLMDTEYSYLSYFETNTNFQLSPKNTQVQLKAGKEVKVEIKGKKDEQVDVSLHVIFYRNKVKKVNKSISLNTDMLISIPQDVDAVRFALRIRGKGNFQIYNICIDDIVLWDSSEGNGVNEFSLVGGTSWYVPTQSDITFRKSSADFFVDLEEGKHVYLPYREGNANFAGEPQNPIQLQNKDLTISFEGSKDSDVNVALFLIFYEADKKVRIEQIGLNDRRLIHVEKNINAMRLAIRVAGRGAFKIENIAISGNGYWLNSDIMFSQNLQFNYDYHFELPKESLFNWKKDNKILYHDTHNAFESKLIGNQFMYVSCFEDIDIHEAPEKSLLYPKNKHYYEFYAGAETSGEVEATLFVLEYKYGRKQKLHQVPFNKKTILQFNKNTTDIKCFVRISNQGYFRNLYIGVNENAIKITNSLDVDLHYKNWFQTGKLLELSNEDNAFVGGSHITSDKKIYLSYKEKNNKFTELPTNSLMPIQQQHVYEFYVRADVEEGLELLPMFIGYSGDKKVQVLQLKLNMQTIVRPHPDVKEFRIAFRISGLGKFKIQKYTVKEMEVVNVNSEVNWINSQETSILEMVPEKPLKDLKMAVIFDEFTTASYKEECELITFTPENWLEVLNHNKPDLLMVESAWQGNGGTWNKRVGYYGEENMKPLFTLLKWCNENNIPTVFWNKEDPVHFDRFIETAKRFDYIFTTDENMIPSYQERAGHNRVYALPFAAQPIIHNPIKIVEERDNKACFAGSYYRHHEERSIDMDRVLDKAAKYGLEIFDRNYEKNKKGLMPNHCFPERFNPYIKGSLKYYEIDKAYKGYKVMINVNTVKQSPTMFSRRVFEGLACGTPVVSTYAQGVENIFGDLVYISENENEIEQAFDSLLNDERAYRQKSLLGIREVLSKHTYTHRLKYITEKIGVRVTQELPKVTVLAFARSKEEFSHILEQFEQQGYKNKELNVLVDTFTGYLDVFAQYNSANVKTFVRSYMHNYQNILEWIDTPYIAYFSQNDYYGRYYLSDLMLSTTFTDSDFIGKHAYFGIESNKDIVERNKQSEYEFVGSLSPARTVAKTNVFTKEALTDVLNNLEAEVDFNRYFKYGKTLYSNDKYNYLSGAYTQVNRKKLKNMIKQIEL
ncbi:MULTISPECIES: CgeB family protein [Bacillus cereus group]|uniref:CgeB family protein n=1 Tax=Bacillus cereus group TaxID=86661 RepID=UPI000BF9D227|nr:MULTISPECIES: glycosyltransferase [Bacillus cereus group]PFO80419.1 glycosyltransferase [Bacillus cereus]